LRRQLAPKYCSLPSRAPQRTSPITPHVLLRGIRELDPAVVAETRRTPTALPLPMTLRALFAVALLTLAAIACDRPPPEDRETRTRRLVTEWIEPVDPSPWERSSPEQPIVIYADRSASMIGFLDPDYRTQKDYRSVIDGLHARLAPDAFFSFGTAVLPIPGAGLHILGNAAFYTDRNTELEQVVDSIARDTALQRNHIILGDARRSDPNSAHRQFIKMRELAQRWTSRGGTFLVAVSQAPFHPVPNDPSGCYAPESGRAASDSALTCPLYAFVFAAPGDGMVIATVLDNVFEHIWAFPIPTAQLGIFELREQSLANRVRFEPEWLPAGGSSRTARFSAEEYINDPSILEVVPSLGAPAVLRSLANGSQLEARLSATTVGSDTTGGPQWATVDHGQGYFRFHGQDRTVQAFRPGDVCTVAGMSDPCGILYRLELVPTGRPAWLGRFEAESAADRARTFGVGRLFEAFAASATSAPALARIYLLMQ
jgi:hypothetical protein